jgi:hypothetical protein
MGGAMIALYTFFSMLGASALMNALALVGRERREVDMMVNLIMDLCSVVPPHCRMQVYIPAAPINIYVAITSKSQVG